jgi:hypothetical protein
MDFANVVKQSLQAFRKVHVGLLFGIPVVPGRLLSAFTALRRTKRRFTPRKILFQSLKSG